jgi:hypothetical protein
VYSACNWLITRPSHQGVPGKSEYIANIIREHDTKKAKNEENKMKSLQLMSLANIRGTQEQNQQ